MSTPKKVVKPAPKPQVKKPEEKKEEKKIPLVLEADEMLAQDKAVTALQKVLARYKEYLVLFYKIQKEVRETKPAPEGQIIAEKLVPIRVVCDEQASVISKMSERFLDSFPSLTGEDNPTPSMFEVLPKEKEEKREVSK